MENGIKKNNKIDILLFADDILLVCTTKIGLQELLRITEKIYVMTFNEKLVRSKKNQRDDPITSDLMMNGKPIKQVTSITNLGVEISNDLKNNLHLIKRKK